MARWRFSKPRPLPQVLVLAVALFSVGVGAWPQPSASGPAEPPVILRPTVQPFAVNQTPPVVHEQAAALDCAVEPCLALTFDDGPDGVVTPHLLDILHRHQAKATFFVLGNRAAARPDIIRRMYAEGHEIGNHSWDHADLTKLSPAQIEDEVIRTQQAVRLAGVPTPTLFRPPYGAMNPVVKQHIPLTLALWNIDPEDWRAKKPQEIVDRVNQNARPGRVIDFHDTHAMTADSLELMLPELQAKFHLVTVSQLFDLAPGQRGEFYGR